MRQPWSQRVHFLRTTQQALRRRVPLVRKAKRHVLLLLLCATIVRYADTPGQDGVGMLPQIVPPNIDQNVYIVAPLLLWHWLFAGNAKTRIGSSG